MTPTEGVEALLKARDRVERAELELEAAKAEVKELEFTTLPPIFLQARVRQVSLSNGAQATKAFHAHARLAKEGPQRLRMLSWLDEIGEGNIVTAQITADWPRGQIEVARKVAEQLKLDETAHVQLNEDVHWKTLEGTVLRAVQSGKHIVPLDEIGATVGDRVKITRNPTVMEKI